MSRRPGRNTPASKEPGDSRDVSDIAPSLTFPICKMGGRAVPVGHRAVVRTQSLIIGLNWIIESPGPGLSS